MNGEIRIDDKLTEVNKILMKDNSDILSEDSTIKSVRRTYPYYKIVYTNKKYLTVTFIILYDYLKNVLGVLDIAKVSKLNLVSAPTAAEVAAANAKKI
jgi:hypothetical protein